MKTKKQKSKKRVVKKVVRRQKKVVAVAAPIEYYKVEIEVMSRAADNTAQYTYAPYSLENDRVEEAAANLAIEEMKSMGIGGRLIHLDGTPEGKIVLTWGSIDRTAAAEKIETAALDGAGQN